jgi:hypothetical protein
MNNKIQKQGRSPLAILQQNKRDDARLFFKLEAACGSLCPLKMNYVQQQSSLLFCASRKQPVPFVHF